jgi:hypothetical protein
MVRLRTVPNAFHARVIAARLGADGILTQLRGSVDGPYPIGDVSVWVAEEDVETASELLMADEVESALEPLPEGEPSNSRRTRPFILGLSRIQLLALAAIALVLWVALLSRVAG